MCRIVRRRITYGHARRVPYGLSPDRVRRACCVPYRPSPDHVPYRPSPTHVSSQLGPPSATSVSLPSSPLGTPNARRLPCPGPTYACSRRRQPWFTNVYSFTLPWRFIMARSAARLRRIVGPLASRHTMPNRPGSRRDRASSRIIGYHRTYSGISGHIPDISGHIRTCHDRRVRKEPVPDRMP